HASRCPSRTGTKNSPWRARAPRPSPKDRQRVRAATSAPEPQNARKEATGKQRQNQRWRKNERESSGNFLGVKSASTQHSALSQGAPRGRYAKGLIAEC